MGVAIISGVIATTSRIYEFVDSDETFGQFPFSDLSLFLIGPINVWLTLPLAYFVTFQHIIGFLVTKVQGVPKLADTFVS